MQVEINTIKEIEMVPYTYLIGWKLQNKFYYGVRYAKKCHPDDLMVSYFTSSAKVTRMIDLYGLPDITQIRKLFKTVESARLWEHQVLRRMKVTKSEKWLNQTDNKSIAPQVGKLNHMYGKTGKLSPRYGMTHSNETKRIISEKSKNRVFPLDFSNKMRKIVTGRKHLDSTKLLISQKLTGRIFSDNHKKNISLNHDDRSGNNNTFFGKTHSEESKRKMKESRKNFKWIHNPLTGERTLVNGDIIETYLTNGWVKGKGRNIS
jgi:hypothetical protein